MPAPSSFDYALVRVVPDVEREELINAGVTLHCRDRQYLGARIELDEARLLALAPDADLPLIRRHLATFPLISAGGPAAGPIGQLPPCASAGTGSRRRGARLSRSPRRTPGSASSPKRGCCG